MSKNDKLTFREAFTKLEEISRQLEDAELDVEEGMKLVQEASTLHKLLKKKLANAKLVITEK